MTSKLIFVNGPWVLGVLRGGICRSIPAENCQMLHTWAKIADLVALPWGREMSEECWGNDHMAQAAFRLLFVDDDQFPRLQKERLVRHMRLQSHLQARPGDILVILPGSVAFPRGATSLVQESARHLRQSLVQVIHVGLDMDAGLKAVYRHMPWKKYAAPSPRDIETLVQEYPGLKLSIYDVLRSGKSPTDARNFQNSWMRGELEIAMDKIDRKSGFIWVDPVLTWKFKSLGIEPMDYKAQGESVATYFGLRS